MGRHRAWLKAAAAAACATSGALAIWTVARRGLGGPRVHIVGLHRVVDSLERLPADVLPSLCITSSSLQRLGEEARRRFEVLPLDALGPVLSGHRALRRDALVITFDDGYRDVYLRALPILRALGLPATVFVPTGFIGSPAPLPHDRLHALLVHARAARRRLDLPHAPRSLRDVLERADSVLRLNGPAAALDALLYALSSDALGAAAAALEDRLGVAPLPDEGARVMSEAELRACVDGGIQLGAHTVDHAVLTRESAARVRRELLRPRHDLEAISGTPCRTFAWCNGRWSPPLVAALREAGYTLAVTTRDRPNLVGARVEPLLLGRKVLHEGHVRGAAGRYSAPLAAVHLHDLFGALGLTRPVDGHDPGAHPHDTEPGWRRSA